MSLTLNDLLHEFQNIERFKKVRIFDYNDNLGFFFHIRDSICIALNQ